MFCGFHCMGGRGGHVKDTFCGLWSCLQHLCARNTNTVPNIQHVLLSRYYSGCHILFCIHNIYTDKCLALSAIVHIFWCAFYKQQENFETGGKRKRGGRGFLGHDVLMCSRDVRELGGGNDVP